MVSIMKLNVSVLKYFTVNNFKLKVNFNSIAYYSSCGKSKVKTINIADQVCRKSAPTKLLVPEECLKDPCSIKAIGKYKSPRVTPIYICKPQEMKRICPPEPCKCPPRKPPKTLLQTLGSFVWFGMKMGIAGAVVYITVDNGLWEGSEQSSCLYGKILNHVLLFLNKEIDEEPEVPKMNDFGYKMKQNWNKGVVTVCTALWYGPTKLLEIIRGRKKVEDRKRKPAENEFGCIITK